MAERLSLRERAGRLMLAVGLAVIPLLPRRLCLRLGELFGRAIYLVDRRHRRLALTQLAWVYGPGRATRRIAHEVFENLGRLIVESFCLARLTPAEVKRRVDFEGMDNLWRALERGRGCLVLTAHFGAFELMPAAVSLAFGRRINIVARRMDWETAHQLLVRLRLRTGNPTITKGRAMRRLIRLLEAGEVVGLLPDQSVTRREGVFVDFLGRPACTNKGVALMALYTGAPVVPFRIEYLGRGRHRVAFFPEVELIRTGDRKRDAFANTELFSRIIEEWVRERPGHWFWMHRRWKTRPPQAESRPPRDDEADDGAGSQAA
jgi:KDO2-lipid IV(A) lauroyltransferase